MDRAQLEGHQATLRGLRDTIAGMANGTAPFDTVALTGCVVDLACILADFIDERIVAGEHAHAVDELIKRPGACEQADNLGGPWENVPADQTPTKRFVREHGRLRAQKVDEQTKGHDRRPEKVAPGELDPRD